VKPRSPLLTPEPKPKPKLVTPFALRSKLSTAPNPKRLLKSAWLNRFISAAVEVMPPAAYTHDGWVSDGKDSRWILIREGFEKYLPVLAIPPALEP
jgi:hypothetical protein